MALGGGVGQGGAGLIHLLGGHRLGIGALQPGEAIEIAAGIGFDGAGGRDIGRGLLGLSLRGGNLRLRLFDPGQRLATLGVQGGGVHGEQGRAGRHPLALQHLHRRHRAGHRRGQVEVVALDVAGQHIGVFGARGPGAPDQDSGGEQDEADDDQS